MHGNERAIDYCNGMALPSDSHLLARASPRRRVTGEPIKATVIGQALRSMDHIELFLYL